MEKEEIKFCCYCGSRLDEDNNFCPSCGHRVRDLESDTFSNFAETKKCPNCGYGLDSFMTRCPACGSELRNSERSSAIQNLVDQLQMIEERPEPEYESSSVLKSLIGVDFKNHDDERRELLLRFRQQIDQDKAELITNFVVPNTREDILEFTLLAQSKLDFMNFDDLNSLERRAWEKKLNNVYNKAKLCMNEKEPALQHIEEVRNKVAVKSLFKYLLIALMFCFLLFPSCTFLACA